MLTIFTTCKAFKGHFTIIQDNAIKSWTRIKPRPEIILFGDDKGIDQIAKRYSLKHIDDIKKNDKGTPILSDIFDKARKVSKNKILCYLNADIILPPDFAKTVENVPLEKFLVTGRRWNFKIDKKLDFKKNWFKELEDQVKKKGRIDQQGALDYFVFPKSVNFKMPDFAVGRGAWDNWLIYKAKLLKIPVIDATEVITAVHQKHDYSHAGGYRPVWYGEERAKNLKLARDKKKPFNLINADYIFAKNDLRKPEFSLYRYWRAVQVDPLINPQMAYVTAPIVFLGETGIKVYRKLKSLLEQ